MRAPRGWFAVAPRLALLLRSGSMRGALKAGRVGLGFLVAALLMGPVGAVRAEGARVPAIIGARYIEPTTRYAHGVLGDEVEWGALELKIDPCPACAATRIERRVIRLPQSRVFEDLAPRLVDLDGDRRPEVIVIESHADRGARLAVYGAKGVIAATPYIGRRNRWLAPVGAADLDGDGHMEIAYIDRPHLAKHLRVWRYKGGALRPVADMAGLTNHRIGWDYIVGGIRDCGKGPEMVTADGGWRRVMVTGLRAGRLTSRAVGPYQGRDSIRKAMTCR